MKKPSKEQVINLHKFLIDKFGGEYGIRDESLLDLSLYSPYHTFYGIDLYPGNIQKIVHLSFSLIKNHPFIDGNKRLGAHILITYLEINNYTLNYSQNELIEIILDIASSTKIEEDLLHWVYNHLV